MNRTFLLLVLIGCSSAHSVPLPYEGIVTADETRQQFTGDVAGGVVGRSVSCVGDLNGDGFADLVVGGPGGGQSHAGAVYVFYGPLSSVSLSEVDAEIMGAGADDSFGVSVASAGDLNGDGLTDLLVGAWEADPDVEGRRLGDAGAAYVFFGPISGARRADDADLIFQGARSGDSAGFAVSGLADINGDGRDDLAVTAFHARVDLAGKTYLYYGPLQPGTYVLDDADASFFGEAGQDHLGLAIASVGDLSGDGLFDVAIGAPLHDGTAGIDSGAVYVLSGPLFGEYDVSTAAFLKLEGEAAGDQAGSSVAGVGDLSGDERDDLFVGAPLSGRANPRAGAGYLIRGPASGVRSLGQAETIFQAEHEGDLVGIAAAGDAFLNQDSNADLVIGAWGVLGSVGAAYVLYGPIPEGVVPLADAPAVLLGEQVGDGVGASVSMCDADADGHDDVFLGAWGNDTGARNGGAVYAFFSGDR